MPCARWLAALILAAVLAPPLAAQGRQRCRQIPFARAHVGAQVVEIRGPEGSFRFRTVYYGQRCENGPDHLMMGLADESGRFLIRPGNHRRIIPLTAGVAMVDRSPLAGSGRLAYDIGRGPRGTMPLRITGVREEDRGLRPRGAAAAGAPAPHTVVLPLRDGRRAEFRNAWVELSGDRLLVHAVSEDSALVSQVWSADGEPLSPVVGRVEEWTVDANQGVAARGDYLLSATYSLQSHTFEAPQLYLPLTPEGLPMPMPEGAIGVFPVPNPHRGGTDNPSRTVDGWGVVFLADTGVALSLGLGRLEAALEQASAAARYTGFRFRRYCASVNLGSCAHYVVRHPAGGWSFRDADLDPIGFADLPMHTVFADPDATIQEMHAMRAMSPEALRRHRSERQWTWLQQYPAALCTYRVQPDLLPREGLERYFRECEVSELHLRLGEGVSAEARALAQRRVNERRAQLAAEEERRAGLARAAIAREEENARRWSQGFAAAQRNLNAGFDAVIDQQRAVYYRNLQAYNSGAQNWCCGAARPPD